MKMKVIAVDTNLCFQSINILLYFISFCYTVKEVNVGRGETGTNSTYHSAFSFHLQLQQPLIFFPMKTLSRHNQYDLSTYDVSIAALARLVRCKQRTCYLPPVVVYNEVFSVQVCKMKLSISFCML